MSFEQEIWVRFWNALFTGIFTGLFVGVFAGLITWGVQKRGDRLLKERERALEVEKESRALRRELVQRVSELNGGFYFKLQRFWRQESDPASWGATDEGALDKAYLAWAMSAEALERDIGTIYGWESQAEIRFHQTRDLLAVRYFGLRDKDSEQLRNENAEGYGGKFHSGLDANKLRGPKTILNTFRDAGKELDRQLLTAPFEEYVVASATVDAG